MTAIARFATVFLTGALLAGCDRPTSAGQSPADPAGDDQPTPREPHPRAAAPPDGGTLPPDEAAPRGHLVIVGGGATPAEATRKFVELAGGAEAARVVILPMAAGGAGPGIADSDAAEFRAAGVKAVEAVVLTRAEAEDAAVGGRFEGATGVWFSGGQQRDLMAVLHGTPAAEAVRRLYRDGAVVGGTSAGAAVMSGVMIAGGERRPSATPTTDTGTYESVERDNILLAEGLGLLPGAIVDQHFLRRRRHNRLISVVLERPELLGVGIDESTALLVNPDGSWEVLGDGQVLVLDAREARVTPAEAPKLGAADVRLHVLVPGSRFEPEGGRASLTGEDAGLSQ